MFPLRHSWVIVAISCLISSIYLGSALRLCLHQRRLWFLSPLRPHRRGHMVRRCWRGCCSWITYSPWWSHVGSQWWSTTLSSIYQTEAILCHVLTYLLTCFIWEQMLMWWRCRWKSLLSKFSYQTVVSNCFPNCLPDNYLLQKWKTQGRHVMICFLINAW